jgi:4-carboxymuconolactone decarboxylase
MLLRVPLASLTSASGSIVSLPLSQSRDRDVAVRGWSLRLAGVDGVRIHLICMMQAMSALLTMLESAVPPVVPMKGESAVDYREALRLLAINDEHFAEESVTGVADESLRLDPKTLALVRIGALVAVGGAVPSYGAEVDAAVSAGATVAEIVEVLLGVVSVVGLPSVVTAAPSLAMALGYDINDALEQSSGV